MCFKKTAMLLPLAFGASTLFAGTQGEVPAVATPYLGIEGSYTWNGIDRVTRNTALMSTTKDGWGGRLSAGITRAYNDKVSFMGEIGGGYYGSLTTTQPTLGISRYNTIDGYDILVGGIYHFMDRINAFFAVGFMSENNRFSVDIPNLQSVVPGGVKTGAIHLQKNLTQTLPEIKAGLIVTAYQNIEVLFNYMYVFGSNVNINTTSSDTSTQNNKVVRGGIENPFLSTVFLGLRYTFV
ncbi:MAG: hypothetical protein P1U32_08485 [Legionellaceae bacterium]|nr:hypothetical protein [Legionellaceae bacterium]